MRKKISLPTIPWSQSDPATICYRNLCLIYLIIIIRLSVLVPYIKFSTRLIQVSTRTNNPEWDSVFDLTSVCPNFMSQNCSHDED